MVREGYSPGWKFNEWEMKGVPIRIEIDFKDVEKNEAMVVRRDTGEKQSLPLSALETEIRLILDQMQKSLYEKACDNLKKNTQTVEDMKDAEKALPPEN